MMPEEPTLQTINWKDFNTLMTSYKNMIEVNTVVFEQLKKIIEIQQSILQKTDQDSERQKIILDGLTQLMSTLTSMTTTYKDMSGKLEAHSDNFARESKTFSEKFQNYELNLVKSDSRIVNKIYVAWGLMGTISISLIGLVITILQRNSAIEEIAKVILQIAKKLGVNLF
jgi:hypothetical protein